MFCFFWPLRLLQRAKFSQDRAAIHSEWILTNSKRKQEQRDTQVDWWLKGKDPTVTNDYENLLISLAFIIVDGNLEACPPSCSDYDGITEGETDGELSLSVFTNWVKHVIVTLVIISYAFQRGARGTGGGVCFWPPSLCGLGFVYTVGVRANPGWG